MRTTTNLICGASVGLEYVHSNPDADIEYPCIIIDLLIVRIIVEFMGR